MELILCKIQYVRKSGTSFYDLTITDSKFLIEIRSPRVVILPKKKKPRSDRGTSKKTRKLLDKNFRTKWIKERIII